MILRTLAVFLALGLVPSSSVFGATPAKRKHKKRRTVKKHPAKTAASASASPTESSPAVRKVTVATRTSFTPTRHSVRKRVVFDPWTEPTFADSTQGDHIDGEDLTVRRAAVQALGQYNGTVVVVNPNSGRILAMVNQNLAYKSGFQPCSTIKLVAALAGLNEGLLERTTAVRIGRRGSMNLTEALARSNNYFFATLGNRLGFERVTEYAKLFGLGEKATLNPEEQAGTLPDAPPAAAEGGVGLMTSFGSGINLSPLQLAALVSAIANGGTLYYLQHPESVQELEHFVPRVKRQLNIAQWIPEIKPGMNGAVEYGTARRASYDQSETIYGKTGTCSDIRSPGIHLGWFGSFDETGSNKVAVVVLLTGGRPVSGPVASGIGGAVYRNLAEAGYFGQTQASLIPAEALSHGLSFQ